MSGMPSGAQNEFSAAVQLEGQLALALSRTSQELSRLETLDDEQRAEVYTILEAMKADTEIHRAMVEVLRKRMERPAHA